MLGRPKNKQRVLEYTHIWIHRSEWKTAYSVCLIRTAHKRVLLDLIRQNGSVIRQGFTALRDQPEQPVCPSWQPCFVLRVFTASHKTRNKVVLSLMDSSHHTMFRTMFCPSWIHDIVQYSEQCCFVPHGFTTSHNIQNNVDLFFIASRHQAIIRTTVMRHCLTTSRDRRNNVVLSFVASRYHTVVWTTLFYSSQLHHMVRS